VWIVPGVHPISLFLNPGDYPLARKTIRTEFYSREIMFLVNGIKAVFVGLLL
jgi:hypothetical protein